jgi:anaerobic ribonucleoside-triphosphate reductase activating protein
MYELILEFTNSENDITISGGEPLLQLGEVIAFMRTMNQHYGKRFWLYTGFTYEEIPQCIREELAKYVDVLVDGKFIKELADTSLLFRGSSNQRLIDLGESVKQNKIILWEDNIYETNDGTLG